MVVGGGVLVGWRVRQAAWRQAGEQYCWRRIGVKTAAQIGQAAWLSLRMSLRRGGIGWSPFVVGRVNLAGRDGVGRSRGVGGVGRGFGCGSGGYGRRGCHDARVAGAEWSSRWAPPVGAAASGLGVARALAVVRVSRSAVRAWIWRWMAAGFRVG